MNNKIKYISKITFNLILIEKRKMKNLKSKKKMKKYSLQI